MKLEKWIVSIHSRIYSLHLSIRSWSTEIMRIALFFLTGCLCYVAANDIKPMEKQCGKHEIFNQCGTPWFCEPTCDEPLSRPCVRICVPGCFCEDNFIRKHANGTCICKDDCERRC